MDLFDRVRGAGFCRPGWRLSAARVAHEIEAVAWRWLIWGRCGRLAYGGRHPPHFLHTLASCGGGGLQPGLSGVSVVVRDLRAGAIEEQLVEGLLDVGIAFYPHRTRGHRHRALV